MQMKHLSKEIKNLRRHKQPEEIKKFLSEIECLSSFKQQAACQLYSTHANQIIGWKEDKRRAFLVAFEQGDVPPLINRQLQILRRNTNFQFRLPFYSEISFIMGMMSGLFPYIISGLSELLKISFEDDEQKKSAIERIFGSLSIGVPSLIIATLLITRYRKTRSFQIELMNQRFKKTQKESVIKSEKLAGPPQFTYNDKNSLKRHQKMQMKHLPEDTEKFRKIKSQEEVKLFLNQIGGLSIYKQKVASLLFSKTLNELCKQSHKQRAAFLMVFDKVQIPLSLNDHISTLKNITNIQFKYPFFIKLGFLMGIISGLSPYIISGLKELLQSLQQNKENKKIIGKIFGWIFIWAPIVIIGTLFLIRHTKTKSLRVIKQRKQRETIIQEIQSEGGMRNQ